MAEEKTMQTIVQFLEVLLEQAKSSGARPADVIFKMILTVLLMTKSFRRRLTRGPAVQLIAEEIERHFRETEENFDKMSNEQKREIFKSPMEARK